MGKTVLIVDDDENVLTALRLLLKSEGIACVTCRSPQQALEALRTPDCQLALVDLNYVEDTTGKEGLRLISALHDPRSAERAQRQIALFDGKIVDDRRVRSTTASVQKLA